jgi:MoxR-like ATPase
MNVITMTAPIRAKLSLPFGRSATNLPAANCGAYPLPAAELRRIVAEMVG